MKRLTEFLKTTILGGLLVLLPILLLYLLLDEIFELVVTMATPIADLFPKGTFDEINFPVLIAVLLIVIVSFLLGLTARSASGRRIGKWIERTILERIPLYSMLKRLTAAFIEKEDIKAFKPALLLYDEGGSEPAYVVEEHDNEYMTILLPWAPAAFAGSLKIVPRDRVELLDVNLGDYSRVLSHLGMGLHELLEESRKS